MEVWMGEAAVVMPLVFQFTTSQERLDNLEKVRSCLCLIHSKGYIHKGVYWRKIGYIKYNDEIVVILIDLNARRVKQEQAESRWIDDAIEKLKKRAGTEA
jgi:hypothetical protein